MQNFQPLSRNTETYGILILSETAYLKLEETMYQECRLVSMETVREGIFRMVIDAPEMAAECAPGQFVMIKAREDADPFLMRPISLNSVDKEAGTITLLVKIAGRGTELMSRHEAGDTVTVLGPLGKGFPVIPEAGRVALIGRGIGIAPMRYLTEEYRRQGTEVWCYLSGRSEDTLYDKDYMEAAGAVVRTSIKADEKVTSQFEADIDAGLKFDAAFVCGSKRLASDAKALHAKHGFPAYLSLEEHMACGVGACKACVCKAKDPATGEEHYARVCKNGPVFDVDDLNWI